MRFNLYEDVKSFHNDTYDVLLRHEAQNLIPLGNLIIGNEGKDKTEWRDPAGWFMATVTGESGILLTAIMTPPFNLTLYATDNIIDDKTIACLIKGVIEAGAKVPGTLTEKTLALRFAKSWAETKSVTYRISMEQRIYELQKVNPEIAPIGTLRPVEEKDMSFLPYWIEGFNCDCFGGSLSVKPDPELYRYHITNKNLYILEDNGTPVSTTQIKREMKTVCGVSGVYTPPYFRGKGYATSCVAGVSRLILERGFTRCALYTDLANPASNSIYQKIGYRPVCDSLEIKFD
jgi:predicted GNAT family acetyltransferase